MSQEFFYATRIFFINNFYSARIFYAETTVLWLFLQVVKINYKNNTLL